ncbi:unnamed protein product, partial [Symbiodinium pilosum]
PRRRASFLKLNFILLSGKPLFDGLKKVLANYPASRVKENVAETLSKLTNEDLAFWRVEFVHEGRKIRDNRTLDSYDIRDGETIQVIVKEEEEEFIWNEGDPRADDPWYPYTGDW